MREIFHNAIGVIQSRSVSQSHKMEDKSTYLGPKFWEAPPGLLNDDMYRWRFYDFSGQSVLIKQSGA